MSGVEQTYDTGAGASGETGGDPVLPALTPQLLAAYLATEVVDGTGVVWSGVDALDLLEACWVITADNPFSEVRDAAQNAAANERLVASIRAAGFVTTPLVGRARDESWSEACVAVRGPSDEQIRAWGREHRQHAVFRLTGDRHDVVSCWGAGTLAARARVLRTGGADSGDTPIRDIM